MLSFSIPYIDSYFSIAIIGINFSSEYIDYIYSIYFKTVKKVPNIKS